MAIKLLTILAALAFMAFLLRLFVRSPRAGVLAVIATAPLEKRSLYAGLTWKPFVILPPPLAGALLWRWWKGLDPRPRFGSLEGAMAPRLLLLSLLSGLTAEAPGLTWRMAFQFALPLSLSGACSKAFALGRISRKPSRFISIEALGNRGIALRGIFQFILAAPWESTPTG
jgi:hypothetical protein